MSNDISPQELLENYLKANKEDHFNYEKENDYKVSSGSLQFDMCLGGGFGPGLHRFIGVNEGGKTSESLQVMKNFLGTIPKSQGLYIKAEGRLGPELQKRSGLKLVFSSEEWVEGTCFVFETNIYETAMTLIRKLMVENKEIKYCFVVDSIDGLIRKGDSDKGFEESSKVAGGAVIASNFCKQTSIAMSKRGHMAIFISQVRADIKLDPYSKSPVRQNTATGGNALLHYANTIMEFEPRFKGDLILQNPSLKTMDAKKNPIIGHNAKVTVKKSPNENSHTTLTYPIRYGRVDGNSIWVEKEIVDLLYAWEFVEKKGAWIKPVDDFKELLDSKNLEFPDKIQGDNNLFKTIEGDKELCLFLIDYFKEQISA